MSIGRFLGIRGLPTDRDPQRQRRRKPLRCQRRKLSGTTFTRAPRHQTCGRELTAISITLSAFGRMSSEVALLPRVSRGRFGISLDGEARWNAALLGCDEAPR